MDLILKNLPRVVSVNRCGHKNRVAVSGTMRYFAVLFPCLLISFQVLGADEWPEIFNRGGVIYKCFPQECPGVGCLVGRAVPPGFVEKGEGRSEGSAKFGARNAALLETLKMSSEPVSGESTDKGTDNRKAAANDCNVVRGYVFHGTKLQFCGEKRTHPLFLP